HAADGKAGSGHDRQHADPPCRRARHALGIGGRATAVDAFPAKMRSAAQGYHACMTRTVASLLAGKPVDASATTLTIPNPADLDVVVAEAALADADTFLEACRVAKDAQRGWGATPAP